MTKKTIFVTGGASGRLGTEVLRSYAARGYKIVWQYHNSKNESQLLEKEFKDSGVECLALQLDLTDESQIKKAFEKIHEHFTHLDIVVNTASSYNAKALFQTDKEALISAFEVNTLSGFLVARESLKLMKDQSNGGVIIFTGDASMQRPYLEHASYFTSKGAIETMTRTLAVEASNLNPNIRVFCIHPGPILPPANTPDEEMAALKECTLVKSIGHPKTYVSTVHYLEDALFATGTGIVIDGGINLQPVVKNRVK